MKIEVSRAYGDQYREVAFFNFESEDVVAYSGLLDRGDAAELATRLREVAHELALWAQETRPDERQTVLPLFGGIAA